MSPRPARRDSRAYKMKVGNIERAIHARIAPRDATARHLRGRPRARPGGARGDRRGRRAHVRRHDLARCARPQWPMPIGFEALDIRWFEEPTQPENIDGLRRARAANAHAHRRFRDREQQIPLRASDGCRRHPGRAARRDPGRRHHRSPQDRRLRADEASAVHLQELQHGGEPRRVHQSPLRLAERRLLRMRHGPVAVARGFHPEAHLHSRRRFCRSFRSAGPRARHR